MIETKIINEFKYRFSGQTDFFANAANFTAIIFENIPNLNWVGFYMSSGDELILNSFQGKAAVSKINRNNGVCGKAATTCATIVVEDVHQFEGHIACDLSSNSEIVLPFEHNGMLLGVLDIDSPIFNRFDEALKSDLESYLKILLESSNLEKVAIYYNNTL